MSDVRYIVRVFATGKTGEGFFILERPGPNHCGHPRVDERVALNTNDEDFRVVLKVADVCHVLDSGIIEVTLENIQMRPYTHVEVLNAPDANVAPRFLWVPPNKVRAMLENGWKCMRYMQLLETLIRCDTDE